MCLKIWVQSYDFFPKPSPQKFINLHYLYRKRFLFHHFSILTPYKIADGKAQEKRRQSINETAFRFLRTVDFLIGWGKPLHCCVHQVHHNNWHSGQKNMLLQQYL